MGALSDITNRPTVDTTTRTHTGRRVPNPEPLIPRRRISTAEDGQAQDTLQNADPRLLTPFLHSFEATRMPLVGLSTHLLADPVLLIAQTVPPRLIMHSLCLW
jgi:hypothetical protein